jgi:hypothetical protein
MVINDSGVKMPVTTTFSAIADKASFLRVSDGKHYTRLNASAAFCHDDATCPSITGGETVLAKVCASMEFVDPA